MSLEDIGKNFEGPSWSNRIFFYFCLFSFTLIAFFIVYAVFKAIDFNYTIPYNHQYNTTQLSDMGFFDNERYLLSALIQSLAATIALVITLSLVAVQLAAQSYSPRIIKIYKNNPDMWILLGIYIITIFYGLGLLKSIEVGVTGINMEGAIFGAYFMGFFAFVCLVPYMLKTLDLLKPSRMIELLAEEITKENILNSLEGNQEDIDEKDPIQPVSDIINRAAESNDYETARNGLKAIGKKCREIIVHHEEITKGEEIKISKTVFNRLVKIGYLAIDRKNEETLIATISVLEYCGIVAAENNHDKFAVNSAEAIEALGWKTTKKELDFATQEIISSVKKIEDVLIEKDKQSEVMQIYFRLIRIIKEAAFKNLQCTEYIIFLLEEIGLKTIQTKSKRYNRMISSILDSLQEIIKHAEENEQENIAKAAWDSYISLKENRD